MGATQVTNWLEAGYQPAFTVNELPGAASGPAFTKPPRSEPSRQREGSVNARQGRARDPHDGREPDDDREDEGAADDAGDPSHARASR